MSNIHDEISELTTIQQNSFDIYDKNNQLVVGSTYVLSYLDMAYGIYTTPYGLYYAWETFKNIHNADFLKALDAWRTDYRPLDNYDGIEQHIYTTKDGSKTEEITHGKKVTYTANELENENKTTSDDSETYRPLSKSIQNGSSDNKESGTTSTKTTHEPTTQTIEGVEYSGDSINYDVLTRHGNMGTTKTQEMLSDETDLRLQPLIKRYLDTFIKECAYLCL